MLCSRTVSILMRQLMPYSTYLVIFEVAVEILAPAELHHGRKGVDINLSGVQQLHYALMARALVHSGCASAAWVSLKSDFY